MLDMKFIRENSEIVKTACKNKNFPVDIEGLLDLDQKLRQKMTQLELHQSIRNQLSKEIPKAKAEEKDKLLAQVSEAKKQIELISPDVETLNSQVLELLLRVPQPARADVPVGKDDSENLVVATWGEPRKFSFTPKDHITLGKDLDILDFDRGVKLAGSRSYILKKDAARLEQAVLRFTYDFLCERGYKPMSVPVLVKEDAMVGTGYFPGGKEQAYCVEKDQLALVGTAEVPLCAMFAGETFKKEELPLKLMAQSSCFRREAGTYGKDTRGLYRVHQFQKIEMVIMTTNDKEATNLLHDELLSNAKYLLESLEIPYRTVYVCTGDLGQGQVRKHDLEAWMPSRNGYGETHSCSSFYDFQARRLKIKYKDGDDRHFAYTLNNTACASPRILIPILENYQREDGSIEIPKCLRPYMNNQEVIN